VFSVGLFAQNQNTPTQASPDAIATVNTEPVTQADLAQARKDHANATLGSLLLGLVDERLLAQRGRNLGYLLRDGELAQLRLNLERVVIAQRVLANEGLAQISDQDARRYYDAHLDVFPIETFETAKSDVIQRLRADKTEQNVLLRPYFQSLRRGAAIIWAQPNLQQAFEQAAR
jgi:hypothetical protein